MGLLDWLIFIFGTLGVLAGGLLALFLFDMLVEGKFRGRD